MSQYDINRDKYVDRNNNLYDVYLLGNTDGELIHRRYNIDSNGSQKISQNKSVFSESFVYDLKARVWEEVSIDITNAPNDYNVVYQPSFSNATSTNNMMVVKSGVTANSGTVIRTKRHFRVNPARGTVFSTAVVFPNPSLDASREIGLTTAPNGVGFRLEGDGADWELYAVRRTNGTEPETIPLRSLLPDDFDPSKIHQYVTQISWNGTGPINFFIDQTIICTMSVLNEHEEALLRDAALPCAFLTATRVNTEAEVHVFVIDVSNEGNDEPRTLLGTVNTGLDMIPTGNAETDVALLAIKVPRTVDYGAGTIYNSRSLIIEQIQSWGRDEMLTTITIARDIRSPNLDGLTWLDIFDSNGQYLVGGAGSALNTAYQTDKVNAYVAARSWADTNDKNVIENPSSTSDVIISPGDIIIISGKPFNNPTVDTYSEVIFSEEL